MIGGHPYLIQFTLYYLRRRGANLETLLENAPTAKSIYIDHLRSLSLVFRECPELIPAWTRVIQSPVAVEIETVAAHRLESLGLIERVSGGVIAANQLYRLYFQQQFSLTGYTLALEDRIARLERENQRLLTLSLVDELTGIGSRTGFDRSLEREWGRSARLNTHLSLILCEIERDPTDPELDDDSPALSRIAGAIAASACRITDYTARYEESRFALLLPETLLSGALIVAERLRSRLENLEIARSDGTFSPPIVNIGIACRQADFETSADSLCTAAEGALEQARTTGENRISIAPSAPADSRGQRKPRLEKSGLPLTSWKIPGIGKHGTGSERPWLFKPGLPLTS
jgi:diguanylate cyclase (GGDEF)-like protein